MVRRIIEKLRESIEKHFNLKEPEDVVVQISGPAAIFKESIRAEAEREYDRLGRELDVENLTIHVKSSMTGSKSAPTKQLFELHGALTLADKRVVRAASTAKEPLLALKQMIKKLDSKPQRMKSKDKNRPRRHFY